MMLYQRLRKEAPELFALTINYSKLYHYACERRNRTNDIILLGLDKLLKFKKTLDLLKTGRWDAAATEALDSDWARQCPNRAKRVTDMIRKGEF